MTGMTRRQFQRLLAWSTAAIAASEAGVVAPAFADDQFILASTGGAWGDALADAFVNTPDFPGRAGTKVAYSHQLESVAASKVLGAPDNAPFSVTSHAPADAVMMAEAGRLQAYDPAVVTHYKDVVESARQAPRAGMDAWFAPINMSVFSIAWNTKLARKPTSWSDLWLDEYKGKVAIPAYGWYGPFWLAALNRSLGGDDSDMSKGLQAISDLVRKNKATLCQNADHGTRLLQQEEAVIMPYMNGRTYALRETGAPIDFTIVPYSYQGGTGFVIPKATKFAKLAQQFVNNTFDPRLQLVLTKRLKYPPSNGKAVLPPEMAAYAIPPAAYENLLQMDWKAVAAKRATNLELWNRLVL